jgi:Tol biopolymer transport system component
MDPEVKLQVQGAVTLQRFVWAPSGQYLYFEGVSQGVRNLWRVTVEPQTLRWVAGPDRLTVGAGEDTDIAISADGKKIALATRLEGTRVWSLPFDPISGQLKGEARPETRAGIDAWWFDVTRDGRQLVFMTRRADKTELNVPREIPKSELWKQSLTDGREALLAPADEFFRLNPLFSPDGTRLTYQRLRGSGLQEESTTILVAQDGDEETPLSSTTASGRFGPTDWSADGRWLLGSCSRSVQGRLEICLAPLSAAPHVESAISVVATHPDLNLFIARFSPDQRWIAIQGVKYAGLSTIYAMPAAGGAIAQITEGRHWDDKPCWGPDGRTIYFVSDRGGFLNVWGIRFDPANGTRVGEPFRVTTFESPHQMVFPRLAPLQLRVTANRLFLNISELSGSIWILDNVDR